MVQWTTRLTTDQKIQEKQHLFGLTEEARAKWRNSEVGESKRKACWSENLDLYNKVRGHLSCKMVGGVGRIEHLRKAKTKN